MRTPTVFVHWTKLIKNSVVRKQAIVKNKTGMFPISPDESVPVVEVHWCGEADTGHVGIVEASIQEDGDPQKKHQDTEQDGGP